MKHQLYENLQSQINVEEKYSGFSVSSTKRFRNGKINARISAESIPKSEFVSALYFLDTY